VLLEHHVEFVSLDCSVTRVVSHPHELVNIALGGRTGCLQAAQGKRQHFENVVGSQGIGVVVVETLKDSLNSIFDLAF
jgi:hypothetical protein